MGAWGRYYRKFLIRRSVSRELLVNELKSDRYKEWVKVKRQSQRLQRPHIMTWFLHYQSVGAASYQVNVTELIWRGTKVPPNLRFEPGVKVI